jgi:hypothetical protein
LTTLLRRNVWEKWKRHCCKCRSDFWRSFDSATSDFPTLRMPTEDRTSSWATTFVGPEILVDCRWRSRLCRPSGSTFLRRNPSATFERRRRSRRQPKICFERFYAIRFTFCDFIEPMLLNP